VVQRPPGSDRLANRKLEDIYLGDASYYAEQILGRASEMHQPNPLIMWAKVERNLQKPGIFSMNPSSVSPSLVQSQSLSDAVPTHEEYVSNEGKQYFVSAMETQAPRPLHKNMVSDFAEKPSWMSAAAARTHALEASPDRPERGRRHYEGTPTSASSPSVLKHVFQHSGNSPEKCRSQPWRFGYAEGKAPF
jgi:hypothetical protein